MEYLPTNKNLSIDDAKPHILLMSVAGNLWYFEVYIIWRFERDTTIAAVNDYAPLTMLLYFCVQSNLCTEKIPIIEERSDAVYSTLVMF